MGSATLFALFVGGFVLFGVGIIVGRIISPVKKRSLQSEEASVILSQVLKLSQFVMEDDLDGALQLATDMVRSQDHPSRLYLIIGDLFRLKGEFHKAVRIHQALFIRSDIKPAEREEIQYHLGLDYYKGGFFNRAIELLSPLVRSSRYRRDAVPLLEEIAYLMDDYPAALRWSRETGSATDARKIRQAIYIADEARNLFEAGDMKTVVDRARQAIRIDPKNFSARLIWGDALFKQGKEDRAIKVWEEGLGKRPELLPLMFDRLEKAYREIKNPEGFPAVLQKIVSRGDCSGPVKLLVAEFFLSRGGYPQAAEIITSYLDDHPESLEGWANLAAIHLRRDEKDQALQDLTRIITLIGASSPLYHCTECGFSSGQHRWRCPQCRRWDTFRLDEV